MNQSGEVNNLRKQFEAARQEHVFAYFDELDVNARKHLISQAASIDLEQLNELTAERLASAEVKKITGQALKPAPYLRRPANGGDPAGWQVAFDVGTEVIAAGRVAAFTVAGGQGTRLGYNGPKGTFPVTPISEKTLFQVFAEKLIRSGKRFGVNIPWFILTSEVNNEATIAAFRRANFFGMEPDAVHFIVQGRMPAIDRQGKILMAGKSTIAMAPDGHGGSLRALVKSGSIDAMAAAGIDCISYFQVDNPLVNCIDPAFIGFHTLEQSELSSKMAPKAYAREKVGVFCLQDKTLKVIEYSDMPDAAQDAVDKNGAILHNAGNIAVHLFDRKFIARVGGNTSQFRLPFHRANKKIPFLDTQGNFVRPDTANGIKFEQFVFDALPLAQNPLIIETARSDEFSPVKNSEGNDSPETCRASQLRLFARWLKAAGETLETDASGLPGMAFEISPLFAVDEADFIAQWNSLETKPTIREGTVIG